ncbi:MAG: oligosaccharide flippase family protein [Taibaiella sp.]
MIKLFRNRNIANTFWNISDTFLYPILFFGSTSFFIQKLGAAQFGIWMLINTIVVSMQLFNFGVGSSVFRNIAYHTAQRNRPGKMQVMSNSISITFLLFVISVLFSVIAAYLVYNHDLLHVEPAFRALCMKGILLAGLIVGFKFFEQIFTAYFKAVEKFNKAMIISSGNKLTALLLNIFMLFFFQLNIVSLLLTITIISTLFFAISLLLLYKDFPQFRFTFNFKPPKKEANFALLTWLQSLAIILTFQTDRYLIVDFFGLAVLSYYAVTATIFTHLHMGFNAILPWLAPKLTKLYAKNADGLELYLAARNLIAACSFIFLLLLLLLYPILFRIVLGSETLSHVSDYVRYFILFELFFALSIIPSYYFNAMGLERKYFYFLLFFAILTLVSMWVCLWIFHQPIAVLYGLVFSCIVCIFVQNVFLNKILLGSYGLLNALLLMVPQFFVAGFIIIKHSLVTWMALPISLLFLYFIYIRGNMSKFKLLFRS